MLLSSRHPSRHRRRRHPRRPSRGQSRRPPSAPPPTRTLPRPCQRASRPSGRRRHRHSSRSSSRPIRRRPSWWTPPPPRVTRTPPTWCPRRASDRPTRRRPRSPPPTSATELVGPAAVRRARPCRPADPPRATSAGRRRSRVRARPGPCPVMAAGWRVSSPSPGRNPRSTARRGEACMSAGDAPAAAGCADKMRHVPAAVVRFAWWRVGWILCISPIGGGGPYPAVSHQSVGSGRRQTGAKHPYPDWNARESDNPVLAKSPRIAPSGPSIRAGVRTTRSG